MKKVFLYSVTYLSLMAVLCTDLFANEIIDIFNKLGGFPVLTAVVFFLVIWIIRASKTKKDDEILDKYVITAVEYALKIMPKDSKIDWVKLVANALARFSEIYTKTNELPPDAKLYDKAKQLIEELAKIKQIDQTKLK